ncbi:MAG: late competence development ComFB family protein [Gammaproteobacteria bacterium]|nr:late competence development ComFB family protein [Gammaproteobacteria bacterium]
MDFSSIHNYYEHLVINYLHTEVIPNHSEKSSDYFLDVACLALTKLPSRYMRHEIDMAFYLDSNEREKMASEVSRAIHEAIEYIDANLTKEDQYDNTK